MKNAKNVATLPSDGDPALRIAALAPRAVRVTQARGGRFSQARFVDDVLVGCRPDADSSAPSLRRTPTGNVEVFAAALRLVHDSANATLAYTLPDQAPFLVQHFVAADGAGEVVVALEARKGEGFYGFGEWFNGFRREQGSLELYNRESPSFAQHRQTYSAIPCFLSDRGYLLLVLNAHRGTVRINDPQGRIQLAFGGGDVDVVVVYGPSFKEILATYTALTGRPPLPPKWCLGLWNTSYPVENQEETLARVRAHREKGYPLDAVILDYHWQEAFHNFQWRRRLFPDPEAMIDDLKRAGVHLGLIYTPYINRRGIPLYKLLVQLYVKNSPDGVPFLAEDSADGRYREALARGYLAHPRLTWWLGRGGALDFTHSEAVDWWFAGQKALLDQGVYFFKNDGGEYLPADSRSAMGIESGAFHNIYGFYYARATFEKSQEHHGRRRAVIFSRTAWAGTQRYPAIFLGDQTPAFKHIAATLRCGLNMSLLGFAWWGADVFGLYRKPTPELHRRYAQWTLFSPIARYFSAPGVTRRDPWGCGEAGAESFRRHLHLRMRLLPHYYRLAREAYDKGLPILRPLILEFPDDPQVRDIWQQVMIGEALMLAPVLSSRASRQDVYFPEGTWYHWWDDQPYDGPAWHRIPVRNDAAPLFVRGGHPLPLGPVLSHIAEDHRFEALEIHCYPPFSGETVLYEDDGTTLDYAQGAFLHQRLVMAEEKRPLSVAVTLAPAEGDFSTRPLRRRLTLVFHRVAEPREVRQDGQPLFLKKGDGSGARYANDARTLTVKASVAVDTRVRWRIRWDGAKEG